MYWWCLSGHVGSPFSVDIEINGVKLERNALSETEIWFSWPIGFTAGSVSMSLSLGRTSIDIEIIVDPSKYKMVRNDFRLMLRDIFADTKSLAALSGFTQGLSRGEESLPIAKIEFVLATVPRLQRLIQELQNQHRKQLRRSTQIVPLSQARGITGRQLTDGLRRGSTASNNAGRIDHPGFNQFVSKSRGRLPGNVQTSRVTTSKHRREHSEILGFLHYLARLLRKSTVSLSAQRSTGSRILGERLARAQRSIGLMLSSEVFAGSSPKFGKWGHSHLYQRAEPYRGIYSIYRDVMGGISGIEGDYSKISLQETYRLYETWVSLRLAHAAALLDPTIDASDLFEDVGNANGLSFSLVNKSIVFGEYTIRFKPTYDAAWKSSGDCVLGSLTHQMIPDIVIQENTQPAGYGKFVVLDSKYRAEAQLNDAINSLHMYRDAIVRPSRTTGGAYERVVTSSFLVTPSWPKSYDPATDWQSDDMPAIIYHSGYQQNYGLGGMVLHPGASLPSVVLSLMQLVDDGSRRGLHEM